MLDILRCLKPYPERKKKSIEYVLKGPVDLEALNSVIEERLSTLLWDSINSNDPSDIAELCPFTEETVSYGDLLHWGRATAKFLKRQKCSPDDIVVVCCENSIYFTPCFLGCLWNGTICAPIYFDYLLDDYEGLLESYNPRFIITTPKSLPLLKQAATNKRLSPTFILMDYSKGDYDIKGCLSLKDIWHDKNPEEPFTPFVIPKEEIHSYCIVILVTSGTMGQPKGARHTDFSMHNFLRIKWSFGSKLISMATTGGYWLMGFYLRLANILAKGTTVVLSTFSWDIFAKSVEKYKVQLTLISTAYIGNLKKYDSSQLFSTHDLSSMKLIFVGGSAVLEKHQALMKKTFPKIPMVNGYSMTEVFGFFEGFTPDTIGHLAKNCQAMVISIDSGKSLPPNEEGELLIKAPMMMQGYHSNPEETAAALDEKGWFHTGDLVYYREDGYFCYVDRIKSLLKFKGVHFNAAEIENHILSHPDVELVCVLGVPVINDWDHAKALVVKVPNSAVTEDDIIKMVADEFPDYKHLRGGVQFIDSMPRTSAGKIHRYQLKKMYIPENEE